MLAFPAEVLTGAVREVPALVQGFAIQAIWLVVWYAACRLAWRRGLLRYGAVGG